MQSLTALTLCLIFALCLSQVQQICTSDASCNNYATKNSKFCDIPVDPLNAVCKDRPTAAFKTSQTLPNGMCTASINHGVGSSVICGGYSTIGCDVPDADTSFIVCANSTRDLVTKKCANSQIPILYRLEGERCDERGIPTVNPKLTCGINLKCIDHVCRPLLKEGDQCLGAQGIGCGVGLYCDGDYCRKAAARQPQEYCKSNAVCISGSCDASTCYEKRSIPCHSNVQCAGGFEVCHVPSGQTRGFCTSSVNAATARHAECLRQKCSSPRAVGLCLDCEREMTEYICAQNCQLREDLRTVSDGYIYNCQALTRTAQPANTCAYQASITNCPVVPISGALANGTSFVLLLICMILLQ